MIVGICERCELPVLSTDARISEWRTHVWHTRCWNADYDERAEQRAEREWEEKQEYSGNRCPERE